MGGLLNSFKNDSPHQVNFFLDFQNVREPTSGADVQVFNDTSEILGRSGECLALMENYTGCSALIYEAINRPTADNERLVWDRLIPSIEHLHMIYDYGYEILRAASTLLSTLCRPGNSLENQTALAKQLCDLFNFVLQFDDKKMMNPHVNNDFSYYRRSLPKQKATGFKPTIADDAANKMSLFYAYPTPMMNLLSSQLVVDGMGVSKEDIIMGLGSFANVCADMVNKGIFPDRDLNLYCLRAMTATIILIDHLNDEGVFCRRSPVNIKSAIVLLKSKADEFETQGLLNSLKYTTRHLHDQDTPAAITELFEQ